jgi:1,4-alpha-glucan branching enzyme
MNEIKAKTIHMKKLFIMTFLGLMTVGMNAQQALWGGPLIISPEIKNDNSVTFRLHAPQAKEVKISGDWIPWQGWVPGSVLMTKEKDTLWTYTTNGLSSDLYGYYFIVDGLRCTDPNNVYLIRDVASLAIYNKVITV